MTRSDSTSDSTRENAILIGCIAVGAVGGFSLVGSPALGTAFGGAVGLAVVGITRRRRASSGSARH